MKRLLCSLVFLSASPPQADEHPNLVIMVDRMVRRHCVESYVSHRLLSDQFGPAGVDQARKHGMLKQSGQ